MYLAYALCITVLFQGILCAPSRHAKCPEVSVVSPCDCLATEESSSISCVGQSVNDLVPVFTRLSEQLDNEHKAFDRFTLQWSEVTELPANVFKDITFKNIVINLNDQLERVDQAAFSGSNITIESISLDRNVKLGANADDNEALFKALSTLINVQNIDLNKNGFEYIPSHAFNSSTRAFVKLNTLTIVGQNIKTIGNDAFLQLVNITHLIIATTSITTMPSRAISIGLAPPNITYNNPIDIRLVEDYKLTADSFGDNWLNVTSYRPATLSFISGWGGPTDLIKYLDECAFTPFLKQNPNNTISVGSLDCGNCENYWIVNGKYQDRIKRGSWTGCDDAADPKFETCSSFSRNC